MPPPPSSQLAEADPDDDGPELLLAAGTHSRLRRRPAVVRPHAHAHPIPQLQTAEVGSETRTINCGALDSRPQRWWDAPSGLGNGSAGPSVLPMPLDDAPLHPQIPSARTNGCGMLVHPSARPARSTNAGSNSFWIGDALEDAAGTVVPLEREYFSAADAEVLGLWLNMGAGAACGCKTEGVGCAVCGNALGALYTPCRTHSRIATSRSDTAGSNTSSGRRPPYYVFLPFAVSPPIGDIAGRDIAESPPPPPPPPALAPRTDNLFSQEFIQSVANGLDDFDVGIFRGDTDINFERDFGQWFNPDEVGTLDLSWDARNTETERVRTVTYAPVDSTREERARSPPILPPALIPVPPTPPWLGMPDLQEVSDSSDEGGDSESDADLAEEEGHGGGEVLQEQTEHPEVPEVEVAVEMEVEPPPLPMLLFGAPALEDADGDTGGDDASGVTQTWTETETHTVTLPAGPETTAAHDPDPNGASELPLPLLPTTTSLLALVSSAFPSPSSSTVLPPAAAEPPLLLAEDAEDGDRFAPDLPVLMGREPADAPISRETRDEDAAPPPLMPVPSPPPLSLVILLPLDASNLDPSLASTATQTSPPPLPPLDDEEDVDELFPLGLLQLVRHETMMPQSGEPTHPQTQTEQRVPEADEDDAEEMAEQDDSVEESAARDGGGNGHEGSAAAHAPLLPVEDSEEDSLHEQTQAQHRMAQEENEDDEQGGEDAPALEPAVWMMTESPRMRVDSDLEIDSPVDEARRTPATTSAPAATSTQTLPRSLRRTSTRPDIHSAIESATAAAATLRALIVERRRASPATAATQPGTTSASTSSPHPSVPPRAVRRFPTLREQQAWLDGEAQRRPLRRASVPDMQMHTRRRAQTQDGDDGGGIAHTDRAAVAIARRLAGRAREAVHAGRADDEEVDSDAETVRGASGGGGRGDGGGNAARDDDQTVLDTLASLRARLGARQLLRAEMIRLQEANASAAHTLRVVGAERERTRAREGARERLAAGASRNSEPAPPETRTARAPEPAHRSDPLPLVQAEAEVEARVRRARAAARDAWAGIQQRVDRSTVSEAARMLPTESATAPAAAPSPHQRRVWFDR